MRALISIIVTLCLIAIAAAGAPAMAMESGANSGGARIQGAQDIGHETLPPNDGWASFSTGTTGGSAATPDHVYTATNRQELVAALGIGATPKIIYVQGTIDANVDDNNQPLSCDDYAAPGYTLEAYLQAYDPATWGRIRPSGPLEDARRASQLNQQARVRINVTPNTTI